MTSKDRLLVALGRGIPDRLPATVYQWQGYHLRSFMGGVDQLEACMAVGLDASISPWDVTHEPPVASWRHRSEYEGESNDESLKKHTIQTPSGKLMWKTGTDDYTTFVIEHPIKNEADAEIFLKHWPDKHLDKMALSEWYDRVGDKGIVRGTVASFAQPGPWPEFCEMVGTEKAILWAMDNPEFVHSFLQAITDRKIKYVHREMVGAKYDLIEHGGGAGSNNVISPAMFDAFCLPYDRQIIKALHQVGHKVVYHISGGMMKLLDRIPQTGCDASEALSPPNAGGDIRPEDRALVKSKLGSKVALIGGLDQCQVLWRGTPEEVEDEVRSCFEAYGGEGGYICSTSDHFFHVPVTNLQAFATAARECKYSGISLTPRIGMGHK